MKFGKFFYDKLSATFVMFRIKSFARYYTCPLITSTAWREIFSYLFCWTSVKACSALERNFLSCERNFLSCFDQCTHYGLHSLWEKFSLLRYRATAYSMMKLHEYSKVTTLVLRVIVRATETSSWPKKKIFGIIYYYYLKYYFYSFMLMIVKTKWT